MPIAISKISVFALIALLLMNFLGITSAQPGYAQQRLKETNYQEQLKAFDYQVTQSGWRNLRHIRYDAMNETTEIWYVCGKRKVLWVSLHAPFDQKSLFELVNDREDKEFWSDDPTTIWDLDTFLSSESNPLAYNLNKAAFTAQLVTSCSAAPKTIRVPAPINAGSSGGENSTFYYILPDGFLSVGSTKTFWISHHKARIVQIKFKPEHEPTNGGDSSSPTLPSWLIKTSPSTVMKVVINCDRNTVGILRSVIYDENGQVVSSYENGKSKEIVPNSVPATWEEISCLVK